MTEKEKVKNGLKYNPNKDLELIKERQESQHKCFIYNNIDPLNVSERSNCIKNMIDIKDNFTLEQPIHFDYGYNIHIGSNFFSNYNFTVLDCTDVIIGDNVFIGPNCSLYTAIHPLDYKERNEGIEEAKPIKIGSNVWLGGSVTVLPGVTIGSNVVIGAGSVVVRDIESNSVAVGNPCKIIKKL